MRQFFFVLFIITLASCHKQLAGPRKVQAIGHISYSSETNQITKVFYTKDEDRAITMKLNKDYTITGDVSGTWAPSGAQILLTINGDFGPSSPFEIDYAYYDTKPNLNIQGQTVELAEYKVRKYLIVVTKGSIGTTYYERHFVFE